MYKAIINFTDLQDSNRVYSVGDVYPRKGYTPTKKRISELLGANNRLGKPVIMQTSERKETEGLSKRKKRRLKDDE